MTMHWGRQATRAAAFTTVMALGQAATAQSQPIELRYDLYMAGLKVYEVGFAGEVSDKGLPHQRRDAAEGQSAPSSPTTRRTCVPPGRCRAASRGRVSFQMRLNDRRYAVAWSGDAPTKTDRSEPLSDNKEKQVNAALTGPLADPLTAVMRLAVSDAAASCSLSQRVYNGKESVRIRPVARGYCERRGQGRVHRPREALPAGVSHHRRLLQQDHAAQPREPARHHPADRAGEGGRRQAVIVIVGASGTINGRSFTASLGKGVAGRRTAVAAAKP